MLLLLKLAWRNLFRNSRRTLLSGLAIGAGLAALIFMDAFSRGMVENMILTATATFPGQAQIHRVGFRKTLAVEDTIVASEAMLKKLATWPTVRAFAPRTLSLAMITSPSDVGSVMLYGVEPDREKQISRLSRVLSQGRYESLADPNRILIGDRLAKHLKASVGDRVVVTMAQAGTGELSQEMFRVGGIFSFRMRELDSGAAFINLGEAQRMLQVGAGVHEIAVDFKKLSQASDSSLPFWKEFTRQGNEALGWGGLFPELKSLAGLIDFSLLLTALILFGIVSFGIMNTLFMSLYERMFEFGILRAVGTRPATLALIIVFEAASLALISIAIGMFLGWAVTSLFETIGIDYRGLELSGVTIKDMIYPVMLGYQYTVYPVWLFVFTTLVGLYPAIYAARLKPAIAMKRTL
jgi:ABC-type lipoprotein release transport system permease subunit